MRNRSQFRPSPSLMSASLPFRIPSCQQQWTLQLRGCVTCPLGQLALHVHRTLPDGALRHLIIIIFFNLLTALFFFFVCFLVCACLLCVCVCVCVWWCCWGQPKCYVRRGNFLRFVYRAVRFCTQGIVDAVFVALPFGRLTAATQGTNTPRVTPADPMALLCFRVVHSGHHLTVNVPTGVLCLDLPLHRLSPRD